MNVVATDVAVLGMGRMGQALALRLLEAQHEVRVWNRTPGKASRVVDAGGIEAPSIASAVDASEVVFSSMATDDAVRAIAFGSDGVLSNLSHGIYCETSTISPDLSTELSSRSERFVALPILGSPEAVQRGAATYLIGGRSDTVARLEHLMSDLAANTLFFDEPRLAHVAKLTANSLLLTAIGGLAEAVAIGRAGGLSETEIRELFRDSPVIGDGVKNRLDALIARNGPTWWTNDLALKDSRLAISLVEGSGTELPVSRAVASVFATAAENGYGDQDIASISQLYPPESAQS